MKPNNKKEAQRFLLSYLSLIPSEKAALLCNMIAIFAGLSNLTEEETEYIAETLEAMKSTLSSGAARHERVLKDDVV